MTTMQRLFARLGPEEPWYRKAVVNMPEGRRYLTNAERAFIVAGRATWLAGQTPPFTAETWEEAAFYAEVHDCCEAVTANAGEDRRNGR